jgi:hypothetical protein
VSVPTLTPLRAIPAARLRPDSQAVDADAPRTPRVSIDTAYADDDGALGSSVGSPLRPKSCGSDGSSAKDVGFGIVSPHMRKSRCGAQRVRTGASLS